MPILTLLRDRRVLRMPRQGRREAGDEHESKLKPGYNDYVS
jgi:hypothetical protein